jgi:prepilin signal peptidase PulO-like enzyme (type II secretory pathway)
MGKHTKRQASAVLAGCVLRRRGGTHFIHTGKIRPPLPMCFFSTVVASAPLPFPVSVSSTKQLNDFSHVCVCVCDASITFRHVCKSSSFCFFSLFSILAKDKICGLQPVTQERRVSNTRRHQTRLSLTPCGDVEA